MSNVLTRLRNDLASTGKSEFDAQTKQPELVRISDQIQELRAEMAKVKREAADKAAEPYLELLDKLEKRYAFLLKLTA